MLTFHFSGADGIMTVREVLTSGMVGKQVRFEFTSDWDNLQKTAVFVAGDVSRAVINVGAISTIPAEVLSKPNQRLHVGVFGVSEDGTLVIPTVMAKGPKIEQGAEPSDDPSTDPDPAVWQQMLAAIGDLNNLSTETKTSLVAAINEVLASAGGSVSTDATLTQEGQAADAKAVGEAISATIDYDQNIKAINHRGYNAVAPENTLAAYVLSKKNGFNYAEADISFTSDGVAVLLHDSTIDRTSDGSGAISSMTYAEALGYDFGSWKSEEYAGTKIPTFEEFIKLCKNIMLHPYIELKSNGTYTEAQIKGLVDIVNKHGMKGKVTWISFNATFLGYVIAYDEAARIGFLPGSTVTEDAIAKAVALKTDKNEVFINADNLFLTDSGIQLCIDAGLPLEIWTVNTESKITAMNPYVTGVTSDSLIAGKILFDAAMADDNSGGEDVTLYFITNSLTNVTNNNTASSAVASSAYTATLTAADGYNLDSVVVAMGGTDVTAGCYADGVVFIASVTGNVVITATATAETGEDTGGDTGDDSTEDSGETETGTLIHSWDFTQGLTDSAGDSDAVLSGATQSERGVTLATANDFVKLCADLSGSEVIYVDVVSSEANMSTHGCIIGFPDTDAGYESGTVNNGFIYRNTGAWNTYFVGWQTDSVFTDPDMISGKTIKMDLKNTQVYIGSDLVVDYDSDIGVFRVVLGTGNGKAFHNVTISAVRIYSQS